MAVTDSEDIRQPEEKNDKGHFNNLSLFRKNTVTIKLIILFDDHLTQKL